MRQFEPLLWEARQRRVVGPSLETAVVLHPVHLRSEWTALPLGRLGRPLVTEIETYLEFFALARADRRDA